MTGRVLPNLTQQTSLPASVPPRGRLRISDEDVRAGFAAGLADHEIGKDLPGVDAPYIFKRRMELRLLRPKGRRKPKDGDAKNERRHHSYKLEGRSASLPSVDNPALSEGRTLYPSMVVSVEGLNNVLIEGVNSRKIGSHISKGPLKGFPIYTLTLEERATCPTSCRHWRSCMGNNMHYAKRIVNDAAFEARLEAELTVLQSRFPGGFAVRLHALGDFYSVDYVNLWAGFLKKFKSMMVFGFSARWERDDPIAMALVPLVMAEWPRFAVRFSNAPVDECSTLSIEHPKQNPDDAIICPAQVTRPDGSPKASSCGACGLCWHTKRRISFLQH